MQSPIHPFVQGWVVVGPDVPPPNSPFQLLLEDPKVLPDQMGYSKIPAASSGSSSGVFSQLDMPLPKDASPRDLN